MSNKFDDENSKKNNLEDELGVAIDEFAMDDEFHVKKADDTHHDAFEFSTEHKEEPEPEYKYEHEYQEDELDVDKYARAESSKERFVDKIRGNIVYILVALIIIVPGFIKLAQFFSGPSQPQQPKERVVTFNEAPTKTPAPIQEQPQAGKTENVDEHLQQLEALKKKEQELALVKKQAEELKASEAEKAPVETVAKAPAAQAVEETIPETPVETATQAPVVQPPKETMSLASAETKAPVPITQPTPEMLAIAPAEKTAGSQQNNQEKLKQLEELLLAEKNQRTDASAIVPAQTKVESIGDGSAAQPSTEIGNESATPSANISTIQEQNAEAVATKISDQILEKYFQQETKVDEQLQEVLNRMQTLEQNLKAVETEEENEKAAAKQSATIAAASTEQFEKLQAQLSALTQTVQELNQRVQEQKVQQPAATAKTTLPSAQAKAPVAKAPAEVKKVSPQVTGIIVEAVIPGRAWIRNQQGVLMVIEVGDEIPGAGKVTRIDAQEGTVATATQIFRQ